MKPIRKILILVLVLVNLVLIGLYLYRQKQNRFASDLDRLQARTSSFKELSGFFKELAEKKGPGYAFDFLKVAPLPENTDLHLLGHVVGDVLYVKEGVKGITSCTEDFRNACSHSIVVGELLSKGEEALEGIAAICKQAPGGTGAYTMCFHGLGHGILAYTGYDLEKAVTLCQKTATDEYQGREAAECVGGEVMEMITGGAHNPILWEEKKKIYLSEADPLYPCTASFMPASAKSLCFSYLTPHLWEVAGIDLGNPDPEGFIKAFEYCETIDPKDKENRDACFGGFGKEFVVLAKGRDVRKIEELTAQEMENISGWCLSAPVKEAADACLRHAVNSLFWGGENDVSVSIKFCESLPDEGYQGECFNHLIGAVNYYVTDKNYLKNFCNKLPDKFKNTCQI